MDEATSSGAQVNKACRGIEEAKTDDERYKVGIYWLLLGTTRAAMARMLLTILMK